MDRYGKKAGKGPLVQTELSGTLGVSQDQTLIAFEPGAASRVGGHVYEDDKVGTIRANAGDNQQAVAYAMVYGISAYDSNSMKSDNPHSGIYKAETARTLDLNGGSPACNQGGMAVVCLEGNGDIAGTLDTNYYKGCGEREGVEREVVCMTTEMTPKTDDKGTGFSLRSRDYKDPQCVCTYQETTGSLMASGYDKLGTQEAMNDMYVVQGESWDGSQTSPTLTANNADGSQRMPDKENFNAVITYGVDSYNQAASEEVAEPLRSAEGGDTKAKICSYDLDRAAFNQGQNAQYDFSVEKEKIATQVAKGPGAVCTAVDCLNGTGKGVGNTLCANARKSLNSGNVCRVDSIVRRLTPLECTRLQGFPDGWVDIGEWTDSKGKIHKDADSPKYKALGNSIALPFWHWMAERIVANYPKDTKLTMASLFDGIGGFPLVCSWVGIKPVWASEIEEFPIAVTKRRFPDEKKCEDSTN